MASTNDKQTDFEAELAEALNRVLDAPFDDTVEDEDIPFNVSDEAEEAPQPKQVYPQQAQPNPKQEPVESKAAASELRQNVPVDNISPKYLARLVVVLTVISAMIAGMLAVVNALTKDTIAENNRKAREEAVLAVFPEGDYCKEYINDDGTTLYFVASGETLVGYCVNVSPAGYSGNIDMMVGLSPEGAVSGIQIVSLSETPGVGTKVTGESFLSQFIGKITGDPLVVGENVDGIGGATFSSKAVTAGINEALSVEFELAEAAASVGLTVKSAGDQDLPEITIPETSAPDTAVSETSAPETSAPETQASEIVVPPVEIVVPETKPWVPETKPWVPETGTPETGTPETGTPETGTPETGAPETGTPETGAPETSAPETGTPETGTPETGAPETGAPETGAPETGAPETGAPETGTPETGAPETGTPETGAPETGTPETDAPETDAPETDAPGHLPIM